MNGEEDVNYLNTLERYNKDSKNFALTVDGNKKQILLDLTIIAVYMLRQSQMVRMSDAKFIGGAPLSDLSSQVNNFVGRLNDCRLGNLFTGTNTEIIRS